jgi:hypothetical protein
MQIKVNRWKPSPMSKAGLGFYPVTKFVGVVTDDQGNYVSETGKCATYSAAYKAAEKRIAQVSA